MQHTRAVMAGGGKRQVVGNGTVTGAILSWLAEPTHAKTISRGKRMMCSSSNSRHCYVAFMSGTRSAVTCHLHNQFITVQLLLQLHSIRLLRVSVWGDK